MEGHVAKPSMSLCDAHTHSMLNEHSPVLQTTAGAESVTQRVAQRGCQVTQCSSTSSSEVGACRDAVAAWRP